VWYNYIYHLQHNIEVPIKKLKAWATILSQPFLQETNVPDFMEIDPWKKSWRDLYYADDVDDMLDLEPPADEEWTEIGSKQKSSSKSKTSNHHIPGPVQDEDDDSNSTCD
jgi:hypothetical protein